VIEQPIGTPLSRDLVPGEDVDEWEKDAFLSKQDKRKIRRQQEEADRATEASWKAGERRAAAQRRERVQQTYLDNQRHLRSVYYRLFTEKDALIKQMEPKGGK
jgi:hypothetical protein